MDEKKQYIYEYPHPAVTADCVIFGFDGRDINILLIERGIDPFKGSWALPGGFVKMDESIEDCARRELMEETNLHLPSDTYLEQFHVFSAPERDPRERVLTVAFFALVKPSDYEVSGGDDACRAQWFNQDEMPPLAFDHEEIIRMAKEKLKERLRTQPIAFKLLNDKFSITELQTLYERILGVKYDRRNFYRKVMSSGLLAEKGVSLKVQASRHPNLYSVDEDTLEDMRAVQTPGKFPFDF